MSRNKPRAGEIITRLVEIGTERLRHDAGLDDGKARVIMREVAYTLSQEIGGSDVYWPKGADIGRDKRDEDIRRDFTGANSWELAAKYNLTVRQIQFICSVMRKQSVKLNQVDLPGIDDE